MVWKLMWPMLILIMRISMGSRELLWPTIIGLFSVLVVGELRNFGLLDSRVNFISFISKH